MSQPWQPEQQPQPGQLQPHIQPSPYGQPPDPGPMAPHGQPGRPVPTAPPKSGGVALILSFLIPGLGHLYTGNPISAVVWFLSATIAWISIGVLVGFVLVPAVYIGAMIHAYMSATNFNRRHHAVR